MVEFYVEVKGVGIVTKSMSILFKVVRQEKGGGGGDFYTY